MASLVNPLLLFIVIGLFTCTETKEDFAETKAVKSSVVLNSGFEGEWEWEKNDLNQAFSITIIKQRDSLYVSYCSIAQQGNKIDCPMENEYSFKVPKSVGNSFESEFKTYFSSSLGKVRLTLLNNKLEWKIIKEAEGEFYCPLKALMIKE